MNYCSNKCIVAADNSRKLVSKADLMLNHLPLDKYLADSLWGFIEDG